MFWGDAGNRTHGLLVHSQACYHYTIVTSELERARWIEHLSSAWKAEAQPLDQARILARSDGVEPPLTVLETGSSHEQPRLESTKFTTGTNSFS
jgi:hypothetical protein